jgi:DNA mismatch repair protein MutS
LPGAADKSYGIHVAQLAGVPRSVNERAREVLTWLEAQHQAADGAPSSKSFVSVRPTANGRGDRPSSPWQMTLFGFEEHPLLEEIRAADLEGLEPKDAFQLIASWQQRLASEWEPVKR